MKCMQKTSASDRMRRFFIPEVRIFLSHAGATAVFLLLLYQPLLRKLARVTEKYGLLE